MSIVDPTASLTLTWTGLDDVGFLAGTLASATEMLTEVEDKINRGPLTASTKPSTTQITRWLIRAKETFSAIKNFTFMRRYAYATLVVGTWRYALPPDYRGGETFLRFVDSSGAGVTGKKIAIWPKVPFDANYPDPADSTNALPAIACVKDNELWFNVPPDGTYRVELEYDRTGADNTANDFSYLPEIYRFWCCDFACWQALVSVKEMDMAMMYKQEWEQNMTLARRWDGKRRYKGMNFQVPVWGVSNKGQLKD